MNISADTLFHFTGENKYLTSILQNGLFIRYSLESYGGLLKSDEELVLPMTCFCDIPLSNVQEHTSKYGYYAIGLSKEWGIKNGVSPVLYAHNESDTAKLLNSLSNDLDKVFSIDNIPENDKYKRKSNLEEKLKDFESLSNNPLYISQYEKIETLSENLGHFLKYIKPYEGEGYSNGEKVKGNKIRFYDEREWRYVPPKEMLDELYIKDIYKRKFYSNPVKRRYINMKLAAKKKLTFKPNDIKFIVLRYEKEIPDMIEQLRKIYDDRATNRELMMLTSRIISLEQIIKDL